jgi:hypothetical protein
MKILMENWRQYLKENEDFGDVTEAIEIDLMKSIKKDFEKITRSGISPEMGMSLTAGNPNLERLFIDELERRKEMIIDALTKLSAEAVKMKKSRWSQQPRLKHIQQMIIELSQSLAGIERALSTSNVNSSPDRQIKKVDK